MCKVNPFFETATMPDYLILNRISDQLLEMELNDKNGIVLPGIKINIEEGLILDMIRDIKMMATDNFPYTASIFGHHLTLTILNFQPC